MGNLARVALALISILFVAFPAFGQARELPTDSERLVIETRGGPVAFTVELALTDADRASGLMNRTSMADDHGMLFKFDQTRRVMMWMKNTPLSLDMLFIDEHGKVVRIAERTKPFSEDIIPSIGPVRYVLELNGGTTSEMGIAVGDTAHHRVISK